MCLLSKFELFTYEKSAGLNASGRPETLPNDRGFPISSSYTMLLLFLVGSPRQGTTKSHRAYSKKTDETFLAHANAKDLPRLAFCDQKSYPLPNFTMQQKLLKNSTAIKSCYSHCASNLQLFLVSGELPWPAGRRRKNFSRLRREFTAGLLLYCSAAVSNVQSCRLCLCRTVINKKTFVSDQHVSRTCAALVACANTSQKRKNAGRHHANNAQHCTIT